MTCAVVEYQDGKRTHHTNVLEGRLSLSRSNSVVKLTFTDNSEEIIDFGVAVKLVDDLWLSNNSQFNVIN